MLFIEREYQVDGMDTPLTLQMEEPYQEGRDWVFEYRLLGLEDHFGYTSKAVSDDKLHALAGALFKISADLEHLQRDCGLRISWMGEPRLGLVSSRRGSQIEIRNHAIARSMSSAAKTLPAFADCLQSASRNNDHYLAAT